MLASRSWHDPDHSRPLQIRLSWRALPALGMAALGSLALMCGALAQATPAA